MKLLAPISLCLTAASLALTASAAPLDEARDKAQKLQKQGNWKETKV